MSQVSGFGEPAASESAKNDDPVEASTFVLGLAGGGGGVRFVVSRERGGGGTAKLTTLNPKP